MNTTQCPRLGLEPRPLDPESSAQTMRPPRLPIIISFIETQWIYNVFENGAWNVFFSVIIFFQYLVYDTQIMMGGGKMYSISPEEYIFAALNLYLDIVNLFLYILQLISAARD